MARERGRGGDRFGDRGFGGRSPLANEQEFATEPVPSPPHRHPGAVTGAIPKVRPSPPPSSKQQETRQRQLDSLRRMEDRLKSLAEEEQRKAREKERDRAAKAKDHAALAPPQPGEERQQGRAKIIRC